MKLSQITKRCTVVTSLLLANATVLMANNEGSSPEEGVDSQPAITTKTFEADGSAIHLEHIGLTITPPTGWTVRTQSVGMSLIMHEKEETPQVIDYSKPLFKRNITLTTRHEATPIDETTVEELKSGLMAATEKSPIARDFQIIEHKFFDYKDKNDGILLYSQLTLGEFQMMQMHVLISSQDRNYLLTYTDLANEFQSNEAAFQAAWNTMTTVGVEGHPPVRYQNLMIYGGASAGLLLMLSLGLMALRRKGRIAYDKFADESVYEGDSSESLSGITQSGVWALDGKDHSNDDHTSIQTSSSFY